MNEIELESYRIIRLKEAVERIAGGNKTVFGKRLGHVDGAFIRQMLSGSRKVTEKTIRAVECLPGMKGWFDPNFGKQAGPTQVDAASFMPNVDRLRFSQLTKSQQNAIEEWVIAQIDSFIEGALPIPQHHHAYSKKVVNGH